MQLSVHCIWCVPVAPGNAACLADSPPHQPASWRPACQHRGRPYKPLPGRGVGSSHQAEYGRNGCVCQIPPGIVGCHFPTVLHAHTQQFISSHQTAVPLTRQWLCRCTILRGLWSSLIHFRDYWSKQQRYATTRWMEAGSLSGGRKTTTWQTSRKQPLGVVVHERGLGWEKWNVCGEILQIHLCKEIHLCAFTPTAHHRQCTIGVFYGSWQLHTIHMNASCTYWEFVYVCVRKTQRKWMMLQSCLNNEGWYYGFAVMLSLTEICTETFTKRAPTLVAHGGAWSSQITNDIFKQFSKMTSNILPFHSTHGWWETSFLYEELTIHTPWRVGTKRVAHA